MATEMALKVALLWEDELRAAARLLRQAHEADDAAFPEAARAALDACTTALWGITDDNALAMVAASDIRKRAPARATDSRGDDNG